MRQVPVSVFVFMVVAVLATVFGCVMATMLMAQAAPRFSIKPSVIAAQERLYGVPAGQRLQDWERRVNNNALAQGVSEHELLVQANDFFNQLSWRSDAELWLQEDYWATPIEMISKHAGDCEDYSVGKYFSLESSRFDVDKLRITYVKALSYDQAHMVLTYYESPEAEPLILDNINKRILPASRRQDLLPIYSFNLQSIWLASAKIKKLNVHSMASLPNWKRVTERFRAQIESAVP